MERKRKSASSEKEFCHDIVFFGKCIFGRLEMA